MTTATTQGQTQLITQEDEIRQYHRERLCELSMKSPGQIPQLEEPTYEQKQWIVRRLKEFNSSWKSWSE